MSEDWENSKQYLVKKYFETSLDALCENDESHGLFNINNRSDGTDVTVEDAAADSRELLLKIYELIETPGFFTNRQRQVISLTLGWHNKRYIGPKNISEISKILGIVQPVSFNHMRLIVRKLKKHFKTSKII